MSSATGKLGKRGLVLTFFGWAAAITFLIFPLVVVPVMDRLVEWQVRHG